MGWVCFCGGSAYVVQFRVLLVTTYLEDMRKRVPPGTPCSHPGIPPGGASVDRRQKAKRPSCRSSSNAWLAFSALRLWLKTLHDSSRESNRITSFRSQGFGVSDVNHLQIQVADSVVAWSLEPFALDAWSGRSLKRMRPCGSDFAAASNAPGRSEHFSARKE